MRLKVKQRTEAWHKLRAERIGSSEVFGLVKYYITENELLNVGINPESFTETPYVTAFELYHKFKNPDLFIGKPLQREYEIFGVKVEELVFSWLKDEGKAEIKKGDVFTEGDRIASLDIEAVRKSPDILSDINDFPIDPVQDPNYLIEIKGKYEGIGEDKPLDWRHIFQVQYAMNLAKYNWCQLLAVSLINDNLFERGYIGSMPKSKAVEYLRENTKITQYFLKKREDYLLIIDLAIDRFFSDVRSSKEPLPDDVKNNQMIYNIVLQRQELLGTHKMAFESPEVDTYIKLKQELEEKMEEMKAIKTSILHRMLLSGKMKATGTDGNISLNKISLRVNKNKPPKETKQ